MNTIKEKSIRGLLKKYFIDGLNGMALGFFATLIVGLIIKQLGSIVGDNFVGNLLVWLGTIATVITGTGIGVGVAYSLNASKLVVFSSAVTGFIGANASLLVAGTLISDDGKVLLSGAGDPLSALIAALFGIEIAKFISGKTKVDIILTPIVTIISGGIAGVLIGPPVSRVIQLLGQLVVISTDIHPFFMGIIVSVVMGMALTLPISSAALSLILGLSGLAGGAATVGCSAQMIGFAVASYRENKVNGLIAQGVGTSMLQVPNIIMTPQIWIPPTLASAILGPVATILFKMENNPAGSGMGTSGLVGQLMTWNVMIANGETPGVLLFKIIILHFILPAILTLSISEYMRKKNYIEFGDMRLNV